MQKLIKIIGDRYIICDDSEIQEGDWYYDLSLKQIFSKSNPEIKKIDWQKKITHSTQPLKPVVIDISPVGTPIIDYEYDKIKQLFLQEVKELIGEVDLEILAANLANPNVCKTTNWIEGYNQALKDNKEKKYTEEDINKIRQILVEGTITNMSCSSAVVELDKYIQSLQLKTKWEVEIVDGKLKLK